MTFAGYSFKRLTTLSLCMALASCTGAAGPEDDVPSAPSTLEEAQTALSRVDAQLKVNPSDQKALANLQALSERLDQLNGMVASVQVAPGHSVSFYESIPGVVTIRERRPQGTASAMGTTDPSTRSSVDVFKRLAPARDVPVALVEAEKRAAMATHVDAEAVRLEAEQAGLSGGEAAGGLASAPAPVTQLGDVTAVQSALTGADGVWFRNNRCPGWGDFKFCFPNWSNGGYAQGYFGNSRFYLAPYAGTSVSLRVSWNGSLKAVFAVFVGEDGNFWQRGGLYSPCCFICACQSISRPGTQRWEITDAAGDSFHWGGNMYNGIP